MVGGWGGGGVGGRVRGYLANGGWKRAFFPNRITGNDE